LKVFFFNILGDRLMLREGIPDVKFTAKEFCEKWGQW
jgi:hypothetical protein